MIESIQPFFNSLGITSNITQILICSVIGGFLSLLFLGQIIILGIRKGIIFRDKNSNYIIDDNDRQLKRIFIWGFVYLFIGFTVSFFYLSPSPNGFEDIPSFKFDSMSFMYFNLIASIILLIVTIVKCRR